MLTQQDIDEIEKILDEKLQESIKGLPTKDEFFNRMDEVMGELKTIREEQIVIAHKVLDDHEPRINRLEKAAKFSV